MTEPGADVRRASLVDLVACLALVVQLLLGMVVNLFVTLPDQHPGTNAPEYFGGVVAALGWILRDGPLWLVAHAVVGLVLVVAAVVDIAWARRLRIRAVTVLSSVGAFAVLGAAFNGASFVNYGHDVSSMIMAGLWAVAMSCYLGCLYLTPRRAAGAPPR